MKKLLVQQKYSGYSGACEFSCGIAKEIIGIKTASKSIEIGKDVNKMQVVAVALPPIVAGDLCTGD